MKDLKILEWKKRQGIESYYLKVGDVMTIDVDYEFNVRARRDYWSIYIHHNGEYNATKIANGIETLDEAKEKACKIAMGVLQILDNINENN